MTDIGNKRDVSDLLAQVLAGSWREAPPALEITDEELADVTLALLQSGAGALGWRRVQTSRHNSSSSASELRQAYQVHAVQAVLHELQIKQTVQRLRLNGVDPILVKGWSVARLYDETALRPYGDIDLCVHPDQFLIARKVADDLATTGILIDLHKGFTKFGSQSWDELHSRSRCLEIDTVEVRTLSPEDQLRLLCFHFLREGAWRPLWLCDVAVATETRDANFNWDLCFGSTETSRNYVGCTLLLARDLLQTNLAGVPDTALPTQMPSWLLPSVLKEWRVRTMYQRHRFPLTSVLKRPLATLRGLRNHWPTPIEATMSLNAAFDEAPRWPLQIGSCFERMHDFLRRFFDTNIVANKPSS